ncbi:sodium channel protein Nach-like isoform X2 [Athalia rosae]|uniref:sodium channel protein Nach-like isoform X2 n=1 Tax=Athalia rosae TaxID=37344 RepID=UPI002033ED0B|nr:sodium channel protein Nach-like isoform X2 [Athalia rosae]
MQGRIKNIGGVYRRHSITDTCGILFCLYPALLEQLLRGRDTTMVELQGGKISNSKKTIGWKKIIVNQAKEFCLSTGLHGYKYIAQAHRSVPERITWAVGVIVSLCCAVALMQIAWEYNTSHPTITVIESTHHGIWNYRFPAVTICDINRVSLNRTRDLVRSLKLPNNNVSREDLVMEMRLLNEMLDPGVFGRNVTINLTNLQDIFDFNQLSIPNVMRLVTRNCSEIIARCKWKGYIKPCASMFETSLSRDGLCCSFNYFGIVDSEVTGAPEVKSASKSHSKISHEPRRVTACGYQTGLTVLIKNAPEDYHAAILGGFGVKVMLHDPYDYPDRNVENKLMGVGTEVFYSVNPEVTYSTDDVRSLPVSKRNCIFFDERPNFGGSIRRYSYHNCLAVCRSSTIFEKCGCVPYYHQNLRTLNNIQNDSKNDNRRVKRICNLRDVDCAYRYRHWFETSWPGINVTSEHLPPRITSESAGRPCKCIPDCDLLRYPLESSAGIFDRNNSYHDLAFYEGVQLKNLSVLHVFFTDLVSTQYRRDIYYNWHNLFASFGGLLGLFAGFSLMSGFELIYFFSIRLIADIFSDRKKRRM